MQEALRHRPGLQACVARYARRIALGGEFAAVDDDNGFQACKCGWLLAGKGAHDDGFDGRQLGFRPFGSGVGHGRGLRRQGDKWLSDGERRNHERCDECRYACKKSVH
jgi:hypothetical protein